MENTKLQIQLEKARKFLEGSKEEEGSRAEEETKTKDKTKEDESNENPSSSDPVVIVEQSESDDEEFEAPPGVIFVKRHRKKATPKFSPEDVMYMQMFGR
jgi:hypothetical protein